MLRLPLSLCMFFLAILIAVAGCGTRSERLPAIAYSLKGPSLFLVGEYEGIALEGEMDRTCMVGYGNFFLHSVDKRLAFVCEAKINTPPSEKGRIRGILDCSEGQVIAFSLKNLGPDQGIGIGRGVTASQTMLLFYHSGKEEAQRRFPEVKAEITEARKRIGA